MGGMDDESEQEDDDELAQRYQQRLIDLAQIQANPELLNDPELGDRIYTDLDIAEHTIMISGLPRKVPKR